MRRIKWVVFISGLAAVILQTMLIREGLVLFGGYELISGIVLSVWLIWGGLGSLIFTRLKFAMHAQIVYALLLLFLCLSIVFSVAFLRYALPIFSLPFGETIQLGQVVLIILIALCPTCMIIGAMFPAASRIFQPAHVYLLEGIGAFVGGVLVTFVLLAILPASGILLAAVSLLSICAFFLFNKPLLIIVSLALLLPLTRISDIELLLRRPQMPGQQLIGVEESRYNLIAVTETGSQKNVYTNGVYDFTFPDAYTSEEAVHYALLLHTSPETVLLVGGGMSNCITEISKHPTVKKIVYCELDPTLFQVNEAYIGADMSNDKLVTVFGDARYYIKTAPEKYDVIIINLPDPVNGQLNRFYTAEFFAEAHATLKRGGLFSVRITAPPDIVSPLFAQLLGTVYSTLQTSFSDVVVLPVAKMTFIATDSNIHIDSVVPLLTKRLAERELKLTYVNDYFFDYNLTSEKMQYLQERIEESPRMVNKDMRPVCYYFTTVLWGGVVTEPIRNFFVVLFKIHPLFFLLPLLFIFFFYRRRSIIYVSVFTIGASEIAAEILLIVLFQALYGYVYGWIGAIIACYMLGLACGTLYYLKSQAIRANALRALTYLEFLVAVYFGCIIVLSLVMIPGTQIIIPVLIFGGGFFGGLHFPLSVEVLKQEKAGYVYSTDLIGSSLGALLTAVILVPILGIAYALIIFAVLNLLVGTGLKTIMPNPEL